MESAKGAAAAAQVAAKGAVISVKEAADATIFADSDDDSVPNAPGGEVEPPPVPLPVAEYQEWLLIKEAANLMPTAPLVWRRRYVVVRKGRMDVYDSKEAAAAAEAEAARAEAEAEVAMVRPTTSQRSFMSRLRCPMQRTQLARTLNYNLKLNSN